MAKGKFRSKIRDGAFGVSTNIHRPFEADHLVYDSLRYTHGDGLRPSKLPKATKASTSKRNLEGTRFGNSSTSKGPWRPNNPAKKGYNRTLNKNRYYHTGLYYKEKMIDKTHQEKIWM